MLLMGFKIRPVVVALPPLFLMSLTLLWMDLPLASDIHSSMTNKETLPHPFDFAIQRAHGLINASFVSNARSAKKFDVATWNRTTAGGLSDSDRVLLSTIYGQAESVFEYGLGESTYIADHVGVPRYAGIDSDATWVANARDNVNQHFRFYFADIGPTGAWGYPYDTNLSKNVLDYQLAPLIVEPMPFDVYMVDGRWRLACMLVSFLHASARGADPSKTVVLLHDCTDHELWKPKFGQEPMHNSYIRSDYRKADHLLDIVDHSGEMLCVYKRKPTTTDEELLDLWEQTFSMVL